MSRNDGHDLCQVLPQSTNLDILSVTLVHEALLFPSSVAERREELDLDPGLVRKCHLQLLLLSLSAPDHNTLVGHLFPEIIAQLVLLCQLFPGEIKFLLRLSELVAEVLDLLCAVRVLRGMLVLTQLQVHTSTDIRLAFQLLLQVCDGGLILLLRSCALAESVEKNQKSNYVNACAGIPRLQD